MRLNVVGSGFLLLAAGCSSVFEPDRRSILLPIAKVEAPTTVAPGTSFNVTFTVESGGCKSFDRLETTKTSTALTAVAHGTEAAVGKDFACTMELRQSRVVEVVTPPVSDPFSVVARQPDGTETTVRVRVQ